MGASFENYLHVRRMLYFTTVILSCYTAGWLGSRVVSALDSGAVGPGFKSQPRRCLRQTVHIHRDSVHQATKLIAALLRVAKVTTGWRKVTAVYRRVYDSRHLQADCQEPGSAPEPHARNRNLTSYITQPAVGVTALPCDLLLTI